MITSMKHNGGIFQCRGILLWFAPSDIHVRGLVAVEHHKKYIISYVGVAQECYCSMFTVAPVNHSKSKN